MFRRVAVLIIAGMAAVTAFAAKEPATFCEYCTAPGICTGGGCAAKKHDNLAGAAFGASMIFASVWWRRKSNKS